ncbi:hypothetical protein JD969_09700 [Planctomycetota bacterium]|nr:hypothetical protein JD969_09700 [Planctomycetota bacterium]
MIFKRHPKLRKQNFLCRQRILSPFMLLAFPFLVFPIAFLLLMIIIFTFTDIDFLGSSTQKAINQNITQEHITKAQSLTRLTFPTSSTFKYYRYDQGLDDSLDFQFTLPTPDLENWITTSNKLKNLTWDTQKHRFDNLRKSLTQFRYANYEYAPSRFVSILIDDTDPDTKTIHIFYHSA